MSIRSVARHMPARRLALSLLLLGLALLFVSGAPAQTVHAHKSSCPSASKPGRHTGTAGSCAKHGTHKPKRRSHQGAKRKRAAKRPARKPASSQSAGQTPASCEDGSLPSRSGSGSFSCRDGSEPACDDGSTPTRSASGSALVCLADTGTGPGGEEQCEQEAEGECATAGSAWACEEGSEACQAAEGEESES